MNSSFLIMPYQDALHRAAVIELWKSVFGYDAPRNEPGLVIDKKLAHADGLLFVAARDDKVIGTVMAGYDGHRGWLYSVAVHPQHRHQGVGSALIKYAERKLADLGCVKVNLQIIAGNEAVAGFYNSLGYNIEKRVSMGRLLSAATLGVTMDSDEKDYLWQHFVFNAEQRLKAFNFFVVFSVFANGGAFSAIERETHGALLMVIGVFISLLSVVFWLVDRRSYYLLGLAVPGLKEFEQQFPVRSHLFANDTSHTQRRFSRYTFAFRVLFLAQIAIGLILVLWGGYRWYQVP